MYSRIEKAFAVLLVIIPCGVFFFVRGFYSYPPRIPRDIPPEVRAQILKLFTPSPGERRAAALGLSDMKEKAEPAIPFFISSLPEESRMKWHPWGITSEIWCWAEEGLMAIGEAAVEPLISALEDENFHGRANVPIVLGAIGGERALEALISAVDDESVCVRRCAVFGLGRFLDDRRAVNALIAASEDEDPHVRWCSIERLRHIDDGDFSEHLIGMLSDDEWFVRREALTVLFILYDSEEKRVWDIVIEALRDESEFVRIRAVHILEEWGDKNSFACLMTALEDESPCVRYYSARALGKLGDKRAVGPLISITGHEEPIVRAGAVRALMELGDERAVLPLIDVLKHEYVWVRRASVRALEAIGDARAVEPLIAVLNDADRWVRQQAAEALGKLTGKDFGEDREKWRDWWDGNKGEFLEE